jgi:hypothetical protein
MVLLFLCCPCTTIDSGSGGRQRSEYGFGHRQMDGRMKSAGNGSGMVIFSSQAVIFYYSGRRAREKAKTV